MASKTKNNQALSTQEKIDIAGLNGGIIITRSGQLRQVIKVEPVNFALKSEQDKDIIIGQYQNFLNALHFNIQIVIQSRRLDVTPYLMRLSELVKQEPNELLRLHAIEYIDFIARLTETTNIMDKKFYVAVGFEPPITSKRGVLGGLFGGKGKGGVRFSASEWEKFSKELNQRVEVVVNGLVSLGLKSEALDTQKTIEFIYGIYNPDEATTEKLTNVESLEASVVSTKPLAAPVENKADILNQTPGVPAAPPTTPAPAIQQQPANK